MKKAIFILMLIISAFVTMGANPVIYIDPSFTGQSDGSQLRPFKSVTVIQNNTEYLQKCGTTFLGSYTMTNAVGVTFGSYGLGPRPVIKCPSGASAFRFNNGAVDITIRGLEITSSNTQTAGPLINVRGPINNALIEDCEVYGGEYAIWSHPINKALYGSTFKILKNYLHDTRDDGVYLDRCIEVEIAGNTIYRVNQKWYPGASNDAAPGDGIQLILCGKMKISENKINRSDTGNKFCLIISSTPGGVPGTQPIPGNYIIVEHNLFILPQKTSGGGAGVYIADMPAGMVLDFYFNTFISSSNEFSGISMRGKGAINSNGNDYLCSPGIFLGSNSIGYYSSSDYYRDKLHTIQGGYELK